MHVNLNCFDYNKLLSGLVEHYGLQDNLTDESVGQVFRNLSEIYRRNNCEYLSDDEKKMVECFLGLTVSYIVNEDDDEPFKPISEQVEEGLEKLQYFILNQLDEVPYNRFMAIIDHHVAKFVTLSGSDDNEHLYDGANPEGVAAFMDYFRDLIDEYIRIKSINQFGAGELFILGEIEKHTHPCEVVIDIDVIDHPGAKVKYGDSLITFPLILIEVTGTD
jgi:hypothetical protein